MASGLSGSPGRADAPEVLRVARAGVLDRHHRPHRGGRGEDVRDLVARQEVELLVRVEAALALVDALDGAEPPRPEQRRDARRPRPLAHAVEALAVLGPRGSRRTPRGRGCSGGRGRCPWPARWCPTCSRAAPGRRPRCPLSGGPSGARRAGRRRARRIVRATGRSGARSRASVTSTFAPESSRRWRIPSSP